MDSKILKGVAILAAAFALLIGSARAETVESDWPQWLGQRRDGVWRETGIVEKFPAAGPTYRWRVPIGAGYSGPAVAKGKVFVTDRVLAPGASNPDNPFSRTHVAGVERVLCLNEADGKILWKHEYDCPYGISYNAGPRTTPSVDGDKVYTIGAEGHLFALNINDGKVVWSKDWKKEFNVDSAMWGFSAHPLVDGQKLICLARGKGSTVVAYDKDTGKELWRALEAQEPGYAPPVIYEAGGKRQLIIWHPESINSLDPETGAVYWTKKWPLRSGMSIATPRKMGDLLYFSCFYNGSTMLKLAADKPEAEVVWQIKGVNEKETESLHTVMSTPFLEDGHIYGSCSYGQFRGLQASDGKRLWETYEPTSGVSARWGNAFIVKNGDRFFLADERGNLIIAKLSPKGYEEISRVKIIEPTNKAQQRPVVWSHPAFANKSVYARNDKEIVCVSLAAEK